MNKTVIFLVSFLLATTAVAQPIAPAPADVAAVSVTATANLQVDNDRMTILLQSQAEKPNAAAAASEVNAKMTKALAIAKGTAGVTAKTLNYGTDQVFEKGKMVRWRVSQLLEIETADFATGANLATRLQEDGLNLASLTFGVSPEARRAAMAKLQHDALVEWQSLAKQAAASLGYGGYTPGRLAVSAGDSGPRPRLAAMAAAPRAMDAVTVSAGSSDLVTTVTGEAILTGSRKPQ